MRITEVETYLVRPDGYSFKWGEKQPVVPIALTFIRVKTDVGVEGHATAWLPGSHSEVGEMVELFFRHNLIGRDPLDREAIWQEMTATINNTMGTKATSAVDTALWDLAAKAADLPLYKYLGGHQDSKPAYASTTHYNDIESYLRLADESIALGYQAYKLHPFGVPDKDIDLVRAVREHVGPDIRLMIDPVNHYDFNGAMRVGRVLDELDFYWYEAPIRDEDIAGLRRLTAELSTPIAAGESLVRGIWDYANLLRNDAGDIIRTIGDAMGGITGLRKVGAMCEAFNRQIETHSYGPTLVQAAHLHFMLSAPNSEYYEQAVPGGMLDFGMKDVITVGPDGRVQAPTKPGLGYEVDWDAVDNATEVHKTWN
ncbi:L-alanine-DL-glutamate epimerase-like enolase superfamily enzyme [Nocardioides daedukensis]|uniref:L-alanine-DL-glutamate epimerase-like enolase superfamily enzyme n=1 Tax=Nocardioides daedukensis TaxID=634462 RepID=A0A7Y9S2K9_9ACTN|nr:mandelate racemase/muconate lactonizing enzyme family protein [Nocardioides daedukensis]NYG59854.1 L-alanine-DL-glutamate epimerase-like enolase superfamily enzyme [Nocardioides daedukensis]